MKVIGKTRLQTDPFNRRMGVLANELHPNSQRRVRKTQDSFCVVQEKTVSVAVRHKSNV
jgi:hypothetical protein